MERHYIANSLSVLAELAASGVGITYLPVTAFEHYFRDGRLKVLDVHPCLPTLDYYLVFEERVAHPAVYIVSELAQSLSDFDIKRQ